MTADPSRIADLVDRRSIADLLAWYCERLDEYDIEGMSQVFAEDAVADYGPGRGGLLRGRAAICSRIERGQAEFRRTHHQLGQSRVDIGDSEAAAVTYVTASHERWDGTLETACLRYRDELRREQDGSWLIVSRQVTADVIDGFPGVDWVWTTRAEPGDRVERS